MTLTDRQIRAAKVPEGLNQIELLDDQVRGLRLRVYAGGARTWMLAYRRREDNRRRQVSLGPYPGVTLKKARQLAEVELADEHAFLVGGSAAQDAPVRRHDETLPPELDPALSRGIGLEAGPVDGNDEAAVRNSQGVDILLRRDDLERAKTALANAGFIFRHVKCIDMFLDGPGAKARDAIHVIFSGEKVTADSLSESPALDGVDESGPFHVVDLEPLVRMKLTSYRLKDRVHLLDMIGVGLIDETWPSRFSPELAARLQTLLDNPES